MADELAWKTAIEITAEVAAGSLSPVEIADAMIDRIESVNPALNAFVTFDPDQVRSDAAALDESVRSGGELGALHGVPFSIKELTPMDGLSFTACLLPNKGRLGDRDAALVTRLKAAGGLFLGKTNSPEMGYYGGTDGHLYGRTQNPWKPGYTAGGSSGGAAAAVAAGLGPLAEGADGAGSIRIPAAMCGVVGFKPSLGRIPQSATAGRFNTWAFHGPITRTVADAALMMDVMAGPDPEDPLSVPADGIVYSQEIKKDVTGWRVAWSADLGLGYVDPEVAAICAEAVLAFEQLGATVTEATPQWGDPEEAMWNGIWIPGFSGAHDLYDWDALHGQVDDNLIGLMKEAEIVTAVDVGRADHFRGRMWDTFRSFMRDYDLLVTPTLASAAFPLSQFAPDWLDGTSVRRQILGWLLTYPFNMTATASISVPAGFTSDGRPVGLQISGGHLADARVLRAAANFEAARPWASFLPVV